MAVRSSAACPSIRPACVASIDESVSSSLSKGHPIRRAVALSFACLMLASGFGATSTSARAASTDVAADGPAYGPELEGFTYPFPVSQYRFDSQGESLHMAYLDVPPSATPNGRTAVLLHGKNFCAAT